MVDALRNIYQSHVTCPRTGDGEEPVVMVAGVKAERCRSCAEGTLSDGFWLVEEVGHASHPSLSNWPDVFEGQLVNTNDTRVSGSDSVGQQESDKRQKQLIIFRL